MACDSSLLIIPSRLLGFDSICIISYLLYVQFVFFFEKRNTYCVISSIEFAAFEEARWVP